MQTSAHIIALGAHAGSQLATALVPSLVLLFGEIHLQTNWRKPSNVFESFHGWFQAVTQRHCTLQNVFLFSSVRANKARIGFPSKASSYVKVSAWFCDVFWCFSWAMMTRSPHDLSNIVSLAALLDDWHQSWRIRRIFWKWMLHRFSEVSDVDCVSIKSDPIVSCISRLQVLSSSKQTSLHRFSVQRQCALWGPEAFWGECMTGAKGQTSNSCFEPVFRTLALLATRCSYEIFKIRPSNSSKSSLAQKSASRL